MSSQRLIANLDLRGARVRLREPRVEEAARVYGLIAGRREILDWLEWSGPSSIEAMCEQARHWRTCSDDAADYRFAIARADLADGDSDGTVGAMSLRFIDHPERGDLGYWIGVEHQGRGFASEAVGLALWLAFEALEARSIGASMFVSNLASRRVLEKHGFELCAPDAAVGGDARTRWNFTLSAAMWRGRTDAQRPLGFELTFGAERP